jgi:cysteine-rich repeat protein
MHNMRSLLLAALATIAIPACTQDITGGTGPGGDDQQPTCGNGVVDQGEACDDSNTNNGDGCSSSCQTENTATPRVGVTVDQPTLPAMDLGTSASVVVTLTSIMGYAGDVTLSASAADSTSAAITDWTATLDSTTATVAADGTATAHLTISAMGDAAMTAGTVKLTATFGAMTADASVGVTFNPVYRVTYTNTGNVCALPTDGTMANPYKIKAGRKLAVFNGGTGLPFIIHGPAAPGADGFQHEDQGGPGTAAGSAYMSDTLTTTDTTAAIQFYCHGGTGQLQDSGSRNYFQVVP